MSMTAEIPPAQLNLRQQLIDIARRAGVQIIDPAARLCDGKKCLRTTQGGTPIYKDEDHLRPFFVRQNAGFLDEAIIAR